MSRLVFRLAAPSLALALGFLSAEAVVRAARVTTMEGQSDWKTPGKTLVYRGALGGTAQPENRVTWNSRGENDREWPTTPETVVLGDSFVEAVQLPLRQHASALLGAAKLACSGWGPVQEVRRLEEARSWGWRPSRVVLVVCSANDVRNCRDDEEAPRSAFWVVNMASASMRGGWGHGGEWGAAWWRFFWALDRIKALSPSLTVALATPGYPNGPVACWCAANRVRLADCSDAETIPGDGHWSARGHALAAARVRSAW